jgi:hypothetical protein
MIEITKDQYLAALDIVERYHQNLYKERNLIASKEERFVKKGDLVEYRPYNEHAPTAKTFIVGERYIVRSWRGNNLRLSVKNENGHSVSMSKSDFI